MRGLFFLPKKGDLSLCKNWRGICLLDVCSELLPSILVRRSQIVMEEFGMDAQNDFRPDRGTIDGLFTTFVGLLKRKNMGLKRGRSLLTWRKRLILCHGGFVRNTSSLRFA